MGMGTEETKTAKEGNTDVWWPANTGLNEFEGPRPNLASAAPNIHALSVANACRQGGRSARALRHPVPSLPETGAAPNSGSPAVCTPALTWKFRERRHRRHRVDGRIRVPKTVVSTQEALD